MATLDAIRRYLDELLRIDALPDYPGALNGLQLEGARSVKTVGAAVDASLPVIEEAVASGVDLLLVHHGMFWSGAQRLEGAAFRKLKLAIDAGMAIYSAHLPLDVHGTLGNNILLGQAVGLKPKMADPFLDWKGLQIGLAWNTSGTLRGLVDRVEKAVGGPVHVCAAGPERVRRLGIITGGAGGEVAAVAAAGIDTFLTGEGPHWSYTAAEELGINVIYAGHYATETFGVRALAERVAGRFRATAVFIDHPTGL